MLEFLYVELFGTWRPLKSPEATTYIKVVSIPAELPWSPFSNHFEIFNGAIIHLSRQQNNSLGITTKFAQTR